MSRPTEFKKIQTGVTLDPDIYKTFQANPYLSRSRYINDCVREKLIQEGMLKA